MRELSDKLFLISMLLLIFSFLAAGFGVPATLMRRKQDDGEGLNMHKRHEKKFNKQDSAMKNIIRSKVFWISVIGMGISVILSYM
ncbi:MAG: hypothetical protein K6T85_16665 [Gorillibacterium sp.]|nr:hypothetical protein [Gorillibacterium sp.]